MGLLAQVFSGRDWNVAPVWRLLGAALALMTAATPLVSGSAFNSLFRVDAGLIDQWQRLSGPDEPTGEVVVVGIDAAAIREKGHWPWNRTELAELVEIIAGARPKGLTIDILLTEPGPYAEVNLFRTFRNRGPEVAAMMSGDPDARLAAAIAAAPTTLAVAGGSSRVIDDLPGQTLCVQPGLLTGPEARPFRIECLLFPLEKLEEAAVSYAVTFAEQDLDGVIRRTRAFVSLPSRESGGAVKENFFTAMPVATLTACAAPDCLAVAQGMNFMTEAGSSGYRLRLRDREGNGPPPTPLTPSLAFWLDFGALHALWDDPASDARIVSAAALFQGDQGELERLEGRHVILGLTRLGAIDQHTTPLATQASAPGALIQALAADNILAGRALAEPVWAQDLALAYAVFVAMLALITPGAAPVSMLAAVGVLVTLAPVAASWVAFEFANVILFGATPALAGLMASGPVLIGRVGALRRDLAEAREIRAREEERMDAAREIQLGSLPFDADFTALGFSTASICRPAQQVGGDFFELFQLTDGRLFAAVGDVSGKGLEASLVTAISKTIAGSVADRTEGPLGAALAAISREFIRQAPRAWRRDKGGFVTLALTRIDPATGEAEFAASGCEPPTVLAADGRRRPVLLPDVAPLGWLETANFETARLTLAPGDTILMFTDGVTEAETPEGDLFGQGRAATVASAATGVGAQGVVSALDDAVHRHQAGRAPTDDTTILAITWTGERATDGSV